MADSQQQPPQPPPVPPPVPPQPHPDPDPMPQVQGEPSGTSKWGGWSRMDATVPGTDLANATVAGIMGGAQTGLNNFMRGKCVLAVAAKTIAAGKRFTQRIETDLAYLQACRREVAYALGFTDRQVKKAEQGTSCRSPKPQLPLPPHMALPAPPVTDKDATVLYGVGRSHKGPWTPAHLRRGVEGTMEERRRHNVKDAWMDGEAQLVDCMGIKGIDGMWRWFVWNPNGERRKGQKMQTKEQGMYDEALEGQDEHWENRLRTVREMTAGGQPNGAAMAGGGGGGGGGPPQPPTTSDYSAAAAAQAAAAAAQAMRQAEQDAAEAAARAAAREAVSAFPKEAKKLAAILGGDTTTSPRRPARPSTPVTVAKGITARSGGKNCLASCILRQVTVYAPTTISGVYRMFPPCTKHDGMEASTTPIHGESLAMLEAAVGALRKETGDPKAFVVGGNYTKEAVREVAQAVGGGISNNQCSRALLATYYKVDDAIALLTSGQSLGGGGDSGELQQQDGDKKEAAVPVPPPSLLGGGGGMDIMKKEAPVAPMKPQAEAGGGGGGGGGGRPQPPPQHSEDDEEDLYIDDDELTLESSKGQPSKSPLSESPVPGTHAFSASSGLPPNLSVYQPPIIKPQQQQPIPEVTIPPVTIRLVLLRLQTLLVEAMRQYVRRARRASPLYNFEASAFLFPLLDRLYTAALADESTLQPLADLEAAARFFQRHEKAVNAVRAGLTGVEEKKAFAYVMSLALDPPQVQPDADQQEYWNRIFAPSLTHAICSHLQQTAGKQAPIIASCIEGCFNSLRTADPSGFPLADEAALRGYLNGKGKAQLQAMYQKETPVAKEALKALGVFAGVAVGSGVLGLGETAAAAVVDEQERKKQRVE